MSGVTAVLEDLHEAEVDLHLELRRVSERNRADGEVAGSLRALASWSESHAESLAEEGRRFGLALGSMPPLTSRVPPGGSRRSSALLGSRSGRAAVLVDDLRQVFGDVALVQLGWDLLGEVARHQHDRRLLALAERSSVETQRQLTWVENRLKEALVHAITADDAAGGGAR